VALKSVNGCKFFRADTRRQVSYTFVSAALQKGRKNPPQKGERRRIRSRGSEKVQARRGKSEELSVPIEDGTGGDGQNICAVYCGKDYGAI
jgi:hypothetical protein